MRFGTGSAKKIGGVAAALLSGWLLARAASLHPSWMLAWIASVPVLVAAFKSSKRGAWMLGVIAGVTGGLSVFGYYATVATVPVALLITVLKTLLYAGGVRLAWAARERLPAWIALFAFPAWFAAFDTLIAAFSSNGTAGSPAYSQMDFPPALQVAALGGAPAVTFLVFLSSSLLAHLISAADAPRRAFAAAAAPCLVIAASLGFGAWRIAAASAEPRVRVAIAALDQERALPDDWRASVDAYRPLLAQAGERHVEFVLLPEEIAIVPVEELPLLESELGGIARREQLSLAVGFRVVDRAKARNVLLLFAPDGRTLSYDKQHLVPLVETPKITPGADPALVAGIDGRRVGAAICKDFDFVDVGRSLSIDRAALVLAPAWDFGLDAWLHGRMAMLRAVEGGFTLVRSARDGQMSISDRFGRVLAEAPSGRRAPLLVGAAPVADDEPTIYARLGDLFGYACAGMVVLFVIGGRRSPRRE